MRRFVIALAAVTALAAAPAMAWGANGHRIVGAIAQRELSGRTRATVELLLGPEGLAEASTWPDFMRSAPEPFWQKTASPWHFVTVPAGKTYAEVGAPPEGDAVTALARFAAQVRDRNAPLADRQLALRFIVHIVGDLHQPLHVGNGTDKGGNDVKVTFFKEATNLHAVWDSGLIDQEKLSYSEWSDWLSARLTPQQVIDWGTSDPQVWIGESVAIRDRIYPAKPDLSFDYVFQNKPAVEQQLSKAGVRLAAYLNRLFAEDVPASPGCTAGTVNPPAPAVADPAPH